MSKFVCYTLEGLMQQGQNQVWMMLGTYPTADAARKAGAAATQSTSSRVLESRVMSYFRSSDWWKSPEAPSAAVRAPHYTTYSATHGAANSPAHTAAQKVATSRSDEPSIVA